jgi:hypothetical protein
MSLKSDFQPFKEPAFILLIVIITSIIGLGGAVIWWAGS